MLPPEILHTSALALRRFEVADAPQIRSSAQLTSRDQTGAPIAFGISGGEDSDYLILEVSAELNRRGHPGRRICIHTELGVLTWESSLPYSERLARHVDLPLFVARREKGDLLDRWRERLASTQRRYAALEVCKLVPCWSSSALCFCTSELKTSVINRKLVEEDDLFGADLEGATMLDGPKHE